MKKERNYRLLFLITIFIVIILLGVLVYSFVIKPSINSYAIGLQNEGFEYAVMSVIEKVAPPNCEQVPLYTKNQSVNVIAVECLQQ